MKTIEDILKDTIEKWIEYSGNLTEEVYKWYKNGGRVFLTDGILILPKSELMKLIEKAFGNKKDTILGWIGIENEFGGYVIKGSLVEIWGYR